MTNQETNSYSEAEVVNWCNRIRMATYLEVAGMLEDNGFPNGARAVRQMHAELEKEAASALN